MQLTRRKNGNISFVLGYNGFEDFCNALSWSVQQFPVNRIDKISKMDDVHQLHFAMRLQRLFQRIQSNENCPLRESFIRRDDNRITLTPEEALIFWAAASTLELNLMSPAVDQICQAIHQKLT